jgi:tetratricopeptide (TPR) repeat protein
MAKKPASRRKPSRQQQKELDVEISFIEGLVRRDPAYLEAWQVLGDDYTRRGRFDEGLRVDKRLTRLRPKDPLTHYNLACSYSLTGQIERAAASLEKAVTLGYRDLRWLARDPDLRNLRAHPLYEKLRARIRALAPKGR